MTWHIYDRRWWNSGVEYLSTWQKNSLHIFTVYIRSARHTFHMSLSRSARLRHEADTCQSYLDDMWVPPGGAVAEQRATPTLWNPSSVLSVSHYSPAFIFSPFPLISFSFRSHLYVSFFLSFWCDFCVLSLVSVFDSYIFVHLSPHPHLCSCSRLLCSLHFTCKSPTASFHLIMLFTS